MNDPQICCLANRNLVQGLDQDIWKCNLAERDVYLFVHNLFWKDVVKSWARINFKEVVAQSYAKQVVWLSIHILGLMSYLVEGHDGERLTMSW